jgi:hypothetical protein
MEDAGLGMYIWSTSGDERVRTSHIELDNKLCRWDDASVYSEDGGKIWKPRPEGWAHVHPGEDIQCFPGSTKVASFFDNQRIYRRSYHGTLTKLITPKGEINCTPNHPVLTDKGWIPADRVNIGDSIVKIKRESFLGTGTNPENTETSFDELFSFFSVMFAPERVGIGNGDFHGDISVEQEVDIITPKSVLRDYIKPGVNKAFLQNLFSESNDSSFSECDVLHGLFGFLLTSDFRMSFFSKAKSFLDRCLAHSDKHTLGAISWIQSILDKTFIDDRPGYAELFGKSIDTHARLKQFTYFIVWEFFSVIRHVMMMDRCISSAPHPNTQITRLSSLELGDLGKVHSTDIEFDTVADKIVIPGYKGHIYNLQNENGWYMVSPENYIVHNCRCTALSYWDELVGEVDLIIDKEE